MTGLPGPRGKLGATALLHNFVFGGPGLPAYTLGRGIARPWPDPPPFPVGGGVGPTNFGGRSNRLTSLSHLVPSNLLAPLLSVEPAGSPATELVRPGPIYKSPMWKSAQPGPTYKSPICKLARVGPSYKSTICKSVRPGQLTNRRFVSWPWPGPTLNSSTCQLGRAGQTYKSLVCKMDRAGPAYKVRAVHVLEGPLRSHFGSSCCWTRVACKAPPASRSSVGSHGIWLLRLHAHRRDGWWDRRRGPSQRHRRPWATVCTLHASFRGDGGGWRRSRHVPAVSALRGGAG